ncbi:eukaryotic translation initiation factor 5 [Sorochytrium milnesiophthora]
MVLLNIGGDKDDKFYRYKMPSVLSKIEGRGNGIKTVIPNMSDIAKALKRPPAYPTKYFGCELGAQVKCEEKNDRYIVNGAHDAARLQECLDGFIKKFVLCPACGNPETDLKIEKNGDVLRQCLACGQVQPVDMRHKLINFILNNPPGGRKKSGKKGRKSGTSSPTNGKGGGADSGEEGESDGDEMHRRIQEEVKELGSAQAADDDWAVDMSAAAIESRQREMTAGINSLELGSDDEADGDDPLDQLEQYVKETPKATNKDILAKVKELQLKPHKASLVLVQTLFTADILNELPKRAQVFTTLHADNERAQKYFLGGLERFAAVTHPTTVLKKMPMLLKVAYDEDICEEDVILAWGDKVSRKFVGKKKLAEQVRAAAEPFLKWLKEADDEDDDSEDDDDDDE